MKKEQSVFLFSGGFDCLMQQKFVNPDILLYVDCNSEYSKQEIKSLKLLPEYLRKKIIVDKSLDLKKFEELRDDNYIPFRNLLFATIAFNYGQRIYFGFNEADNAPDKDNTFLKLSTEMFSHLTKDKLYRPPTWHKNNLSIEFPFKNLTKSEMLRFFVQESSDEEVKMVVEKKSCYSSSHSLKGCGECSPCLSKAVALLNNELFSNDLYKNPITVKKLKAHLEVHKKIRPKSSVLFDYAQAIDLLRKV